MARSVFAAGTIAAHLLLAWFLISPWREDTAPISGAGESILLLLPGESRDESKQLQPPQIEPELETPPVVWVPTTDFAIESAIEPSSVQSEFRQGSGRPDVPGTQASDAGIAVLQRVMPQYPLDSVRAGEEGSAVLQVLVDESGHASEVRVARSTGHARLDTSAISAVKRWKFAPSTKGARAVATWGELELRFELYRFTVSRIVDAPMDLVPLGQILNVSNEAPVSGGQAALRALINEVRTTNADAFDAPWLRDELKRMKGALSSWGEVNAIAFKGAAAGNRWRSYEVRPEFRKGMDRETVELRWDVYDVSHDRGMSEWRVAIDRTGRIWCAHAGSVRPGEIVLQVSR